MATISQTKSGKNFADVGKRTADVQELRFGKGSSLDFIFQGLQWYICERGGLYNVFYDF